MRVAGWDELTFQSDAPFRNPHETDLEALTWFDLSKTEIVARFLELVFPTPSLPMIR